MKISLLQRWKAQINEVQSKAGQSAAVTVGEFLYWLFFGALLFAKGIGLYDGQAIFKVVLVFAALCLGIKVCIEKYTAGEYFKILFVMGITGITYLTSGEKGLLLYGAMMAGMKYVQVKRVFWLGTVIWAGAFLMTTISALFHMEDTVYKVHAKLGMGHIFRWSLGYPHPNVLQVSYLILVVFIIYVLGDRFQLKHAFWLFAGNCLVFLYSVSYTGFAGFMVLLLGRIYLLLRPKLSIPEKALLLLIYPACALVSLILPVTLVGERFNLLNRLLSSRMELAWRYLKPEFFSLFGIRVANITTESLTMDNAYLFAFITYGIIPFLLLSVGIIYTLFRYLKQDCYLEALIMITIAISGLTEPFLYNTSFKNLSFLFMGTLLLHTEKQNNAKVLFVLPTDFLGKLKDWILELVQFEKTKLLAGMAAAVSAVLLILLLISYPEGYVVARNDCADLSKEKHYYSETAAEYRDYVRMGDFSEGEEVEYFDGNIVFMEKIRNMVSGSIIGFGTGYFLCGTGILIRRRKK